MIKQLLCAVLLIAVIQSSYDYNQFKNSVSNCTDPNCALCEITNTTCDQCQPNYYEVKSEGLCKLCPQAIAHCSTCSQPNINDTLRCTECQLNYFRSNDICVDCSTAIPNCVACTQTVQNDSITCSSCVANRYLLKDNSCSYCGELIDYCVQCGASTNSVGVQCTKCMTWYFLNNNNCVYCNTQNCADCKVDADFMQPECHGCKSNYYLLDDSSCASCGIDNCDVCQPGQESDIECLGCVSEFYFFKNTCVSCQSLITHCDSCDQDTIDDDVSCSACEDGYYGASQVACEKCENKVANCFTCFSNQGTDSVTCKQCKQNFYIGQDNVCLTCSQAIVGCEKCEQDLKTKVVTCATCGKGRTPSKDQTFCVCADKGSFIASDAVCHPCEEAIKGCATCTQQSASLAVSCLSCSEDRVLSTDGRLCQCGSQYYVTKEDSCSLCSAVISECMACAWSVGSGSVLCSTCGEGKVLSVDGRSCESGSSSTIIVVSCLVGVAVLIGGVLIVYKCVQWRKKRQAGDSSVEQTLQEDSYED